MKSSKYKGVVWYKRRQQWAMTGKTENGMTFFKLFDNERDAAIAYDKKLIDMGLEPVNILKRK